MTARTKDRAGAGTAQRVIRADGDRWRVRFSERPPHPGVNALVFFCVTTNQRPYRVVEVDARELPDASALEALSDHELRDLFERSGSMDFPHRYP